MFMKENVWIFKTCSFDENQKNKENSQQTEMRKKRVICPIVSVFTRLSVLSIPTQNFLFDTLTIKFFYQMTSAIRMAQGWVLDSWPGGFQFETWLRRIFFLAYFHPSPLLKYMRKVVLDLERNLC